MILNPSNLGIMATTPKEVFITDKGGKTIRFKEFNGRLLPPFKDEGLLHGYKIEARPDDLVLTSYPKSGTHWMYEITRCLMAGAVDLPRVEKDKYMIEDVDPAFIDSVPSPRNLNTHYAADYISPDFLAKKVKMIFMYRDPRDLLVSYYNHHSKLAGYKYDGEFKHYFDLFLEGQVDYGSWFDYIDGWEKVFKERPDLPILILQYENMKQDPLGNIRKVSEFMGYNYGEELLHQIVEKSSFDSMRKRNNDGDHLGKIMYRKGISGDWKNWFTVAQSEQFNEVFERKMAGTECYKLYSHTRQQQIDNNMNSV